MIISFAGHSSVNAVNRVKACVREQLQQHINGIDSVRFYVGGYGDFDILCAHVCKELKKEYGNIEVVYVTPYISLSEQRKIKELQRQGLCDASLYPPIENTPPRFAILKRNEWMMANADLIIAYVNRSYGGAYQSLVTAKRKNKKIINICEFM